MREPVYFGVKRRHFAAEGARENEWMGKRVLIVGMARSGIAAAQLLHRAGAVVTVNDGKAEDAQKPSEEGLTDTAPTVTIPVIGMDGKTADGAMPYEILKQQLAFMR